MSLSSKKYTAAAVSYLNTKPFLYGIFNTELDQEIEIQLDIPSVCASKLLNGEVDFGLVPVAVIPQLKTPYLISDYCIGTVGAVKTVAIYSDVPLAEITELYLDFHSRTSVQLAQVLLREYWHHSPRLLKATEGFINNIKNTRAAVVIGDRCIGLNEKHEYVYDLGAAWLQLTGLPFVFAAWVSNRPLPEAFLSRFNKAMQVGLDHIPQLVQLLPTPAAGFDLSAYYNEHISYPFDSAKKSALAKFLKYLGSDKMPMVQQGQQMVALAGENPE